MSTDKCKKIEIENSTICHAPKQFANGRNINVHNNKTRLEVHKNRVILVAKLNTNPIRRHVATPKLSITVPVNNPNTVINAPHAP